VRGLSFTENATGVMVKHRKKPSARERSGAHGLAGVTGAAVTAPPRPPLPSPSTLPSLTSVAEQAITTEASLVALRQSVDPNIESILFSARHVVEFDLDVQLSRWQRVNREGALFLVRYREPRYALVIHNRKNPEDLVEPVVAGMDIEVQDEFLMYRTTDGSAAASDAFARALWFHGGVAEVQACANLLQDIVWMHQQQQQQQQHAVISAGRQGSTPAQPGFGPLPHPQLGMSAFPPALNAAAPLPPVPSSAMTTARNPEIGWNSGWTSPITAWSPSEARLSGAPQAGHAVSTGDLRSELGAPSRNDGTEPSQALHAAYELSKGGVSEAQHRWPEHWNPGAFPVAPTLDASQQPVTSGGKRTNAGVFSPGHGCMPSSAGAPVPLVADAQSENHQTYVNTIFAAAGGRPGAHREFVLAVLQTLANDSMVFEQAYRGYRMQWG
jgi:hypothetical protein